MEDGGKSDGLFYNEQFSPYTTQRMALSAFAQRVSELLEFRLLT
jgi:hypothetical protein